MSDEEQKEQIAAFYHRVAPVYGRVGPNFRFWLYSNRKCFKKLSQTRPSNGLRESLLVQCILADKEH